MNSTPSENTIGGRQGRLRGRIPLWEAIVWGCAFVLLVFLVWWFVTRGEKFDDRIISGSKMPSPAETFSSFKSLWFDSALARSTWASLRRVSIGFGLATIVGVPLGVACGCFPRVSAFLTPMLVFGRNIPMAAVIPLTIILFGIDEKQKVLFIFFASGAFVISDAAQAITNVQQKYVDTAYTLGASRWQIIRKVLFPLALPHILDSLRLLFGLGFGYIMLAEVISVGDQAKGLGGVIYGLERRGQYPQIYLILLVIPIVAYSVDRFLYWCQVELLPHRYPHSTGLLSTSWRQVAILSEHIRLPLTPSRPSPHSPVEDER